MPKKLELTNKQFGYITVLSRAENSYQGTTQWNCVCVCGTTFITQTKYLIHDELQSCGCKRHEPKSAKWRLKNSSKIVQKAISKGNFVGVFPSRKCFAARYGLNGKRIYIGHFRTAIEAAQAYDKKMIELYGDNAVLNFPPEPGEASEESPMGMVHVTGWK